MSPTHPDKLNVTTNYISDIFWPRKWQVRTFTWRHRENQWATPDTSLTRGLGEIWQRLWIIMTLVLWHICHFSTFTFWLRSQPLVSRGPRWWWEEGVTTGSGKMGSGDNTLTRSGGGHQHQGVRGRGQLATVSCSAQSGGEWVMIG